jgi:hypothetical protein
MPKKPSKHAPAPAVKPVVDLDDGADSDDGSTYLSVKDVVLAYTLRGADGLDSLPLEHKSHLLRKAIAFCRLEGNEAVATALVEHANKRGLVVWSGRGRGIPVEGATRSYKAQQLQSADPFIRLPVSALGAKKGQVVTVSFRSGVIEVRSGA